MLEAIVLSIHTCEYGHQVLDVGYENGMPDLPPVSTMPEVVEDIQAFLELAHFEGWLPDKALAPLMH